MKIRYPVLLAALLSAPLLLNQVRAVDFEDLGILPGGQIDPASGFTSGGFFFIDGPSNGYGDLHVGSPAFWGVSNGTNIMSAHFDAIMTKSGGGLFSVLRIDLAGGFLSESGTVSLTGTYADDSTVVFSPILDGIIDGVGGAVDFQSFALPGTFDGLKSLRITSTGAMHVHVDNIVTSAGGGNVPDSGASFVLLALGLSVVSFLRRRL